MYLMRLALHFSKTVSSESPAFVCRTLKNRRLHLQRPMEWKNHGLLYFMNDSTLLVLLHTVTHDHREVLGRLHMPTGTVKPHLESPTLTKAPNSHRGQTGLHEIYTGIVHFCSLGCHWNFFAGGRANLTRIHKMTNVWI